MLLLFENLTQQQADICALVLSSSGLPYRLRKDRGGWGVWVDETHYYQAVETINHYFRENKIQPEHSEKPPALNMYMIISSAAAAVILLVVYVAVHMAGSADVAVTRFGASAYKIINGQLYRTVTALFLHADEVHLAGNMISIAIFGTAVCTIAGWGFGWLMILVCGAFGNLINAFMYESGHISIGASTAVFGAIGILVGYQSLKSRSVAKKRFAAWIPLACGLALLGLLGSGGVRVDIMAHLFGLVSGAAVGLVYAAGVRNPVGKTGQILSAVAVLMIIALSWRAGS